MRSIRVASLVALVLLPGGVGASAAALEVEGRVLGPQKTPVAEARVELLPFEDLYDEAMRLGIAGSLEPEPVALATTDSRGRFTLEAPSAGFWRVRVSAAGYAPLELRLAPLLDHLAIPDAVLQRESTLTVELVNATGAPLQGALVRAEPPRGATEWTLARQSALSDDEGRVMLKRAKRTRLDVVAHMQGSAPGILKDTSAGKLQVTLAAGGTRRIEARDPDGGALEGVLVVAGNPPLPLGFTDAGGALELRLPTEGSLELTLLAPSGARTKLHASRASDPEAPALEVTLADQIDVQGRVLARDDGKPIPGALVWQMSDPSRHAVSGEAGDYSLSIARGARPSLTASSPSFLSESRTIAIRDERSEVSFSLWPSASIEGVVVDGDGLPVVDALVAASEHSEPGRGPRRGRFLRGRGAGRASRGSGNADRTDAAGRFRLTGLDPQDDYEVRSEAPGFAPSETLIEGLEARKTRRGVRVVLGPGQVIRGRVIDDEGTPLAGAEVAAWGASGWGARWRLRQEDSAGRVAASDMEGRFVLDRMPSGAFDIGVTRAGYVSEIIPKVAITEGEDTDLGEIDLEPGVPLFGRVVDDEGSPIADAALFVIEGSARERMRWGGSPGNARPDAVSGADGAFIVADRRRSESVSIIADAPGYSSNQVSGIEVGSADEVVIELAPASTVSGVVVDEDDESVAGATVMLFQRTVGPGGRSFLSGLGGYGETDSEGRFVIEDVRPGRWTLGAGASGFLGESLPSLEVSRGRDLENQVIRLSRGATILGSVRAFDGAAVPRAHVSVAEREQDDLSGMFGLSGSSGTTDAEGRFVIQGIEPGDRTLRVTHSDYPPKSRDLEVEEGENTVSLTLDAGLTVTGRIVDDAGAPIAGAQARLVPPGQRWGRSSEETAPDGGFTLEGIAPGEYEVFGSARGYSAVQERPRLVLSEGRSPAPLEIVLSRSAYITGRVIGLDESDYPDTRVSARSPEGEWGSSATVDYQGTFILDDVRPGPWLVQGRVGQTGRQASAEVTLDADAGQASVDLDFAGGYTLSGRVLRAGIPVDGISVIAQRTGAAQSARGTTNNEGRYALSGLERGEYTVTAADSALDGVVERSLTVSGDATMDLEFPTATISGRVLRSADREALPGAVVSAERLDQVPASSGRNWRSATGGSMSDGEGRFAIEGLAAGSWRLKASLAGYAVTESSVTIADGESLDQLTLELDPTEGLLLQVLSPTGQPVRSARITVLDGVGRALTSARVEASESGTLFVESVPAGSWEVLVSSQGSAVGRLMASAPGGPTALRLERACSLQVTVADLAETPAPAELTLTDASGRSFRTLSWSGQIRSSFALTGGRVTLDEVPPGAWALTVVASDGRRWEGRAQTNPEVPARVTL